ncbi:MAG: DUF6798 domain-containing protein [Lacipirellulaceae bacterium]
MERIGQQEPSRPFEFVLILMVFFIAGGAPAPHVNETQYLAKAKHYWDASFCPSDTFLDTADAHLVFYWTVGWLTKFFSLEATAWIGRALSWGLLAFAWQRLALAVAPVRWTAVLGAALFPTLIAWGNFAGEWVIGGVEAKCFAYGFFLLGMTAMVENRWPATWIWLGLASAFHPLVGGWAVLGSWFVLATIDKSDRPNARSAALGLIVGGLLAVPGLLFTLTLNFGTSSEVRAEAAEIYVFERLPHHLAPLELKPSELAKKAMRFSWLMAAMLVVWLAGRRQSENWDGEEQRHDGLRRLIMFAVFSVGASIVGLAFERLLVGNREFAAQVLRYYWFRQADVAVPLAVATGVGLLTLQLSQGSRSWLSGLLVFAAICGSCAHLGGTALARWKTKTPPAIKKMKSTEDWRDACSWIRENTPERAIFLVDRHAQSFKWYAHRGDVANWKDIPQDAKGIVDWFDRCQKLYAPDRRGRTVSVLAKQRSQTLIDTATEYDATHLLTRKKPTLPFTVLHENETYAVYKLPKARTNQDAETTQQPQMNSDKR